MNIVAIGGFDRCEVRPVAHLFREIQRLYGLQRPALLYLPNGEPDCVQEWHVLERCWRAGIFARIEVADPADTLQAGRVLRDGLQDCELVFVGGGDTLLMLKRWRRSGAATLLARAARAGQVVTGVSAGAICWFDFGQSDSPSHRVGKAGGFFRVKGLGLLPYTFVPHFQITKRQTMLPRLLKPPRHEIYACEDGAALAFARDGVTPISFVKGRRSFGVQPEGDSLRVTAL